MSQMLSCGERSRLGAVRWEGELHRACPAEHGLARNSHGMVSVPTRMQSFSHSKIRKNVGLHAWWRLSSRPEQGPSLGNAGWLRSGAVQSSLRFRVVTHRSVPEARILDPRAGIYTFPELL